jgi:hypothetical protein
MKKEIIAWGALGILSVVIVGIATGFKFSKLDIQLYDTYYVLTSKDVILNLTWILGLARYFYLLTDLLADRYKILALLFSIINAIAVLFTILWTYFSIEEAMTFRRLYPDTDISGRFLLPGIFIGLLIMQTIIEIKMIKKLNGLWANK